MKGIQVSSNKGPRPLPRGGNYEIVKIHWKNEKIFFSRSTEPISTKLGTKHYWVKGIQVCSNEGPCLFQRGDNSEIAKIQWRNWKKILYFRNTEPILSKLGTKHPWKFFLSSLNQSYEIIIFVQWFELFSQVSDVAHGPLVIIPRNWECSWNICKGAHYTSPQFVFLCWIICKTSCVSLSHGLKLIHYILYVYAFMCKFGFIDFHRN